MIKHVVMYRLKEPTDANKKALVAKFNSMRGRIPCLLDIETGMDLLETDRSYDVGLICTFDSLEKLEEYRVSDFHQSVVPFVQGMVKQSCSVDFEV